MIHFFSTQHKLNVWNIYQSNHNLVCMSRTALLKVNTWDLYVVNTQAASFCKAEAVHFKKETTTEATQGQTVFERMMCAEVYCSPNFERSVSHHYQDRCRVF